MRKQHVPVLKDHMNRYGDPVALYLDGVFVRIKSIQGKETVRGKGRCYTCLVSGQELRLWQEYERDYWFVEQ